MLIYADTSLLASYYLPDVNTPQAISALQSEHSPVFYTALHRLELRSAMAQAVFRKRISIAESEAAWKNVVNDLKGGLLLAQKLNWYVALRQAALLTVQHGPVIGCRSLDALHVAIARLAGLSKFFSFDARQRSLAQLAGLVVRP